MEQHVTVQHCYANGSYTSTKFSLVCIELAIVSELESWQPSCPNGLNWNTSHHITDALASLHWLRVSEHILFKVTGLTYRVVNGSAPESCYPTSPGSPTCHPDCGFDHLIPINLLCHPTILLLSAGEPSQSSPPISGIVFLWTLPQHRRSRFSGSVSRLTSFGVPTLT